MRVSPSLPNAPISIPFMEYIFIISCIRLLSSETVIMEEIFLFFNFSTLTVRFSFFSAFFIILAISSACSSISFAAFLEVLAFKESVRSASMRINRIPSFFASSWEIKGWSILWVRITASIFADLNILIYWLCCCASVT